MIKFFRKIRQKLLSENSFRKYLVYAIGEIVLVVIGILIALAINNYNENIKDERLGRNLLERIHNDLVQDTILFKKTIEANNKIRKDITSLLSTAFRGVENKEQVEGMSSIFDKALDQVFSYNKTTFNSMIGSGTLGYIKNIELKEQVVELYNTYEDVEELLASINQWMLNVTSALDTKTNFIKFNNQVSDIFTLEEMVSHKDFDFINNKKSEEFQILIRAITATAFNQKVRNAYYENLVQKCDSVLLEINTELNN